MATKNEQFLRCERLMKERGINAVQLSKETGVSTATISAWRNDIYTPKLDKLIKIADYLGVTVDYLMGRTDNPNGITVDTKIRELAEQYFTPQPKSKIQSVYDELTEEHQNTLLAFAEFLLSKQNKTVPNDTIR